MLVWPEDSPENDRDRKTMRFSNQACRERRSSSLLRGPFARAQVWPRLYARKARGKKQKIDRFFHFFFFDSEDVSTKRYVHVRPMPTPNQVDKYKFVAGYKNAQNVHFHNYVATSWRNVPWPRALAGQRQYQRQHPPPPQSFCDWSFSRKLNKNDFSTLIKNCITFLDFIKLIQILFKFFVFVKIEGQQICKIFASTSQSG